MTRPARIDFLGMPSAPMTANDRQDVAALDRLCLPGHEIDYHAGWWWGVLDVGQIIAFASVHEFEPSMPFLSAVCVHPDYRGRGLQCRLMRHVARHFARVAPDTTLVSYTHATNIWSSNNFIRCGWTLWWPPKRFAEPHWLYWRLDRKPKGKR